MTHSPLLKRFEQPHLMTLSVSPKRQVAMHSHILIRRHVVEHSSFTSLRAALRRLQDDLQRERDSSEALPKVRLYLSDIVAAFDYRLSKLDLLDADAKMLAAQRERNAAFDAFEQAWRRLYTSYLALEDHLQKLESWTEEVPDFINALRPRPIPRRQPPKTVRHELEEHLGRCGAVLFPGEISRITNIIATGIRRDLERYGSLLPFSDTPSACKLHEARMRIRDGQLHTFMSTLRALMEMPELSQIYADAEAIADFKSDSPSTCCSIGYEAFDEAVGRLPIWEHADRTDLWSHLSHHLEPAS